MDTNLIESLVLPITGLEIKFKPINSQREIFQVIDFMCAVKPRLGIDKVTERLKLEKKDTIGDFFKLIKQQVITPTILLPPYKGVNKKEALKITLLPYEDVAFLCNKITRSMNLISGQLDIICDENMAIYLDRIGQRYNKLPTEILALSPQDFAINYEIFRQGAENELQQAKKRARQEKIKKTR